MLAIRLSFYAVAVVFALLGALQAWHAVDAFSAAAPDTTGGLVAAVAALGCVIAALGTVKVTRDLERT
ncbi:hypothetical protein [Roseospira navarrensis]|uniref:Uncharacterized protein n=1 Tax=Roseospira navarrensis TaxID=140058 RepID=A0A7X1ZEE4_9PROT|nr:hypothetical protein [Roseospira navarrensis]MQX36777.1 hypothetical protein [Roseospira navarrensis]